MRNLYSIVYGFDDFDECDLLDEDEDFLDDFESLEEDFFDDFDLLDDDFLDEDFFDDFELLDDEDFFDDKTLRPSSAIGHCLLDLRRRL